MGDKPKLRRPNTARDGGGSYRPAVIADDLYSFGASMFDEIFLRSIDAVASTGATPDMIPDAVEELSTELYARWKKMRLPE